VSDISQWPAKAGRKPSQKAFRQANKISRPGSKDNIAVAMALRPDGTTQKQIICVLGAPHRNKLKSLRETNKVQVVKMPSKDGLRVYKINLK